MDIETNAKMKMLQDRVTVLEAQRDRLLRYVRMEMDPACFSTADRDAWDADLREWKAARKAIRDAGDLEAQP